MSHEQLHAAVCGAAALGYGLFSMYLEDQERKRHKEVLTITKNVIVFRSMGLFDVANALTEMLLRRTEGRYAMNPMGINTTRDIESGSEVCYRRLGDFDMADYCRQYVEYVDSGLTHLPPRELGL